MENEFESGALDEGAVVFQKLEDDTFAIMGSNLIPGEEVEVSTKDGETRSVIVGKILNEQDGIQTAEFTWATPAYADIDYSQGQIYFCTLDNGDYAIKGLELGVGEEVEVTTKDGETKTVIVTEILDTDEDGVQTAAFEWPKITTADLVEQGRIVFTKTETGTWVVTGKGLKEGKEVKVTRKGKTTKEKVIVDLIINDEDGVQTATFTNPATKGKKND